jgi:flagellar hook-associated protein FlgK
LLAQKLKPPEMTNVAPGGSLVRTKDGVTESVFTAPEKLSPTDVQRNYLLAKQQGYPGDFVTYQREVANFKERPIRISVGGTRNANDENLEPTVNNNGVKIGKYDKTGRYISPTGRVFPASAVTEAQKEHDAGISLIRKLNDLSESDIKNAFGSLTDYSTSKIGRLAGPTDTLNAQVKINNLQIGSVLNNLSQLKGASSDKEMAQMIKDFPGYEASPDIMKNWVERASKTTNKFLQDREQRFGFDTEYEREIKKNVV